MSIGNGVLRNEDDTFKPEFFELVSEYEKRLKYARENTSLPAKPDIDRVEKFMMSVIKSDTLIKLCRRDILLR